MSFLVPLTSLLLATLLCVITWPWLFEWLPVPDYTNANMLNLSGLLALAAIPLTLLNVLLALISVLLKKSRWPLLVLSLILTGLILRPYVGIRTSMGNPAFSKVEQNPLSADTRTLRVMSYNVSKFYNFSAEKWFIPTKAVARQIGDLAKEMNVDLLLLQEDVIKREFFNVLQQHTGLTYYCKNGKHSLTSLSRFPVSDCEFHDFGNTVNGYNRFDIDLDGIAVTAVNMHLPTLRLSSDCEVKGNWKETTLLEKMENRLCRYMRTADYRKARAEEILQLVSSSPNVIIAGDMNDVPLSAPYRTFAEHYNDAFVESGTGFAFSFTRFPIPIRLDYAFASKDVQVMHNRVVRLGVSDHYPVYTEVIVTTPFHSQ